MACEKCTKFKEKVKAFWTKTKAFMTKKTWGVPNWLLFLVFPLVLIILIVLVLPKLLKKKSPF